MSIGRSAYLDYGEDGRVEKLRRKYEVTMAYDGRGFLASAWKPVPGSPPGYGNGARPLYSSDGTIHLLAQDEVGFAYNTFDNYIFYFAGRPVAILEKTFAVPDVWKYLVTDHLGTPAMAIDDSGATQWSGGFEPFGRDYQAGTLNGALENDVFLRLPGQWEDELWGPETMWAPLYYNVHRWYENGTGRYSRPDPLGLVDLRVGAAGTDDLRQVYAYAQGNPAHLIDPLGLKARLCCKSIGQGLGSQGFLGRIAETVLKPFYHCYVQVNEGAETTTWGLHHVSGGYLDFGHGQVRRDAPFDKFGPEGDCGDWNDSCQADRCAAATAENYPGSLYGTSLYNFFSGPNSNTFARRQSDQCGLSPPSVAGGGRTPGWNSPSTSAYP